MRSDATLNIAKRDTYADLREAADADRAHWEAAWEPEPELDVDWDGAIPPGHVEAMFVMAAFLWALFGLIWWLS